MRSAVVLVVLAALGCGRLGFEDQPPGDAAIILETSPDPDGEPADARPDAAPVACDQSNVPATCVGEAVMCGDRCFVVCDGPDTREAARQACVSVGAWLAGIAGQDDMTCLANVINVGWIGLTQSGGSTPSAGWAWDDARAYPIDLWNPNEPDDFDSAEDGAEQCVYTSLGGWDDADCTLQKSYICSF